MTDRPIPRDEAQPDGASPQLDIAAGAVLAAISLFALLWLVPNHTESSASEHDLSPGVFPTLAAATVLALSVLMVAVRLRHWGRSGTAKGGLSVLIEVAAWTALSVLVVLGLSEVGFLATMPILIALWMVVGGRKVWWQILLLASLFPLAIDRLAWMIFSVALP